MSCVFLADHNVVHMMTGIIRLIRRRDDRRNAVEHVAQITTADQPPFS